MRLPGALLVLLLPVFAFSQEKKLQKSYLKFGDIKAADFEPSVYEVDSSASAVVLADIGQSEFEGNNDGFFDIIFKHHIHTSSPPIPTPAADNEDEDVQRRSTSLCVQL